MNNDCAVTSVGVAVPSFQYFREDIAEVGRRWLGAQSPQAEKFLRFLSSSHTDRRFFALPAERILGLDGLHNRQRYFEEEGPRLGAAAIEHALGAAGVSGKQVDTLLFTSCSSPSIPSIDALILDAVGLKRTTSRIPIYQHGCAGGVVGLGIASRLAATGQIVALNSVELCSLVFHGVSPTDAELVGSALFADGAACAIVAPSQTGLVIRDHQSFLLPDTRHLMGYDLLDDGFHLRLDRELPRALHQAAPIVVGEFLNKHQLSTEQIQHWLFHPGGVKILDFLEEAFDLKPEQASWSRKVLREYGNLSSATVLFVLSEFLESQIAQNNDRIVMVGVGPGLTIELILFEYRR